MSKQFNRLSRILAKSFKLDEERLHTSFRLARLDDIPSVSDLRIKVFGDSIKAYDREYLQWRYFGREGYPSTLWVFDYNDQVIAALGTEPVEVWIEDHIEPALKNMDAIVEPKFDGRGLGAWMTLAIQEKNVFVLVAGGNENSTSMLDKLFTALPARNNYKIIFNAGNFLEQKFHNSNFIRLITPVVNLMAYLFYSLLWLTRSVPGHLSLRYFKGVDQLIDHIENPIGCIGDIKVVRTQSYLKWRYADNPGTDYYTVALFDQDKLVAYVLYKYEDGWGQGATRMGQIIDWYVKLPGHARDILTFLFIASVKDLKQKGSDEVMMVLTDDLSHQSAKAAGFSFRYVESTFFVYHSQSEENSSIYSAKAWYHSLGDTDTV